MEEPSWDSAKTLLAMPDTLNIFYVFCGMLSGRTKGLHAHQKKHHGPSNVSRGVSPSHGAPASFGTGLTRGATVGNGWAA